MSCLVVANALESGDDLDLDQTAGGRAATWKALRAGNGASNLEA